MPSSGLWSLRGRSPVTMSCLNLGLTTEWEALACIVCGWGPPRPVHSLEVEAPAPRSVDIGVVTVL